MNGIETGVARYIRAANVGDSPEARATLAAIALAELDAEQGEPVSADAVMTTLLERHTRWLLGLT